MIRISKTNMTIEIDTGSAEVKQNIISNSGNTELTNLILAFDTENEIVFCTEAEVDTAFRLLSSELTTKAISCKEWDDFTSYYNIAEDVTVAVMKTIDNNAVAYFMSLTDAIWELVERIKKDYVDCYQWLKQNDISCSLNESDGAPVIHNGNFSFELADREIEYKAQLWRKCEAGNPFEKVETDTDIEIKVTSIKSNFDLDGILLDFDPLKYTTASDIEAIVEYGNESATVSINSNNQISIEFYEEPSLGFRQFTEDGKRMGSREYIINKYYETRYSFYADGDIESTSELAEWASELLFCAKDKNSIYDKAIIILMPFSEVEKYLSIKITEEGVIVDCIKVGEDEPFQTDKLWFRDYLEEDKDEAEDATSNGVVDMAKEYAELHEEREKEYDKGDSERGLEIDMELVSLGLDIAEAIIEDESVVFYNLKDDEGLVFLVKTSLTPGEISNAIYDETLDGNENYDYMQKLTIHAKRLKKSFKRIEAELLAI